MSDSLEAHYRRLLKAYPSSWRIRNGAALLDTLMHVAEADGRQQPSLADRVDLVGRGFAARVDTVLPRSTRDIVASAALPLGFAFSIVYFVFHVWAPFAVMREEFRMAHHFGPFLNPGVILCSIWFAAFVLTLLRRHAAARAALVLAVFVAALTPALRFVNSAWDAPALANLIFLFALGVLAAAGTPTRLRSQGLAASAWTVAFVVLYALNSELTDASDRTFFWRIASPANVGLVMIAVLIVLATLLVTGRYSAVVASTLSASPWLAVSVWRLAFGQRVDGAALVATCTVAVVICGIAAIRPAREDRRRDESHPVLAR